MGMRGELMIQELAESVACDSKPAALLLAPLSATFLDAYIAHDPVELEAAKMPIVLEEVWRYRNHMNLDDMDFGDDGVLPTLNRVIGRRGIGAWKVRKMC